MSWCFEPLASLQWYLTQIGLHRVYQDYSGYGVKVGIYDDGVQQLHAELNDNYDQALNFTLEGVGVDPGAGAHGTAVAGIIAAAANLCGGIGVASNATIAGVNIFSGPASEDFISAIQQMGRFDVTNSSWGWASPYSFNPNIEGGFASDFSSALAAAALSGRDGRGTIIVNAVGNDWSTDRRDANSSAFNQDRHTITVGAATDAGEVASYSNRGASVLVSAPSSGGSIGILTTDLEGEAGYSLNDQTTFGGTSAATPIVSGVVALMLEANPDLGWRDVQDILSLSAVHLGSAIDQSAQGAEAFGWSINKAKDWNGGGLHFSNDYGFGRVNALAAVRMAEIWSLFGPAKTSANEVNSRKEGTVQLGILDGSVSSFGFSMQGVLEIEHVDLTLTLSHADVNQLRVELISPSGMRSVLLTPGVGLTQSHSNWTWTFGSEAFRGESLTGNWTVRIVDTVSGGTGALHGFRFDAFGAEASVDNVYHYTDEFAALEGMDAARSVLVDLNGGVDWVNFAGMGGTVVLDMRPGAQSIIGAGGALRISSGTVLENAVGGDGSDSLVGNAVANHLQGMRGHDTLRGLEGDDWLDGGLGNDQIFGEAQDDTLIGGVGDDLLDGGIGTDTASYFGASAAVVSLAITGLQNTIGAGIDTLRSIENLTGGHGRDRLSGDARNNVLSGQGGHDVLIGDAGDDYLDGGIGADTMRGGPGNDFFKVENASDIVVEAAGEGNDWVLAAASYVLQGGQHVEALSAEDNLATVALNLTGNEFANTLRGNNGRNVLNGGAGNDTLASFAGNDTLIGGAGNDTLSGGLGIDSAMFSGARSAYALTSLGDGNVRVVGPDGTDIVSGVEKLVFGNVTFNWPLTGGSDFNVDGTGDVLWRNNATGQVATWELNGAGGFGADHYGAAGLVWQQVAVDDFNGDGRGDILWRNTATGQVATWELNGTGDFAARHYAGTSLVWQALGSGDFNADGKGDILWRNSADGRVATWELSGTGGFSYDSYGGVSLVWKVAGIGDFNGDGKDDVLWRNNVDGKVATWELNGAGGFNLDHYGAANLAWHIFGVGDFNGDGKDDILWRNDDGRVATWELNGAGGFSYDLYGSESAAWQMMTADDFNSDSKDDILWRNTTNGAVKTWELDGAGRFDSESYGAANPAWQAFNGSFEFV